MNFFGSRIAIDRLSPLSKCLLPLSYLQELARYLMRSVPQRPEQEEVDEKVSTLDNSPITARPPTDNDLCVIAPAHSQMPDILWLLATLVV